MRDRACALLLARGRGDGVRGLLLLAGLGALPRRRRRHGDLALHAVRHGAAQERHRPPQKVLTHYRDLGVEYEEWDNATVRGEDPRLLGPTPSGPPSAPTIRTSGTSAGQARRRDLHPRLGLRQRPQLATHNLQRAAESKGGEFLFRAEVAEIRRAGGRVAGVTLTDGTEIDAPIVVNVAGPHSFVINRMAGVEDEMNVKTRALRHEVHHVPSPPDSTRARRLPHLRRRHRDLLPPRERQQHPHRLRGPRL